ncbi:hypothetical protein BJ138DRAFT_1179089 [Hygrophoropsis aurantiaca]|uniref:Uncharacterized protein n=1 Tax=Hygrophoropsis aurantiaca TaxID=72124 RepID=A0ACB8AHP2_9AGAM|nr:hypothetical protein BJ138DRAFT_1179089 [Hygrophoropsis aurantiaca]
MRVDPSPKLISIALSLILAVGQPHGNSVYMLQRIGTSRLLFDHSSTLIEQFSYTPTQNFHGYLGRNPGEKTQSGCIPIHGHVMLYSDTKCKSAELYPGFDITPCTNLNKTRSLPSSVHNATAFVVVIYLLGDAPPTIYLDHH